MNCNAQHGAPPSHLLEHPCPQYYTLPSTLRSAYMSLHTSTQRLPQHDWPYSSPHPGLSAQHAGGTTCFIANPGPHNTNRGGVVYRSSEINDEIAAQESAVCQSYLPSHIHQTQQPDSTDATTPPRYDPQSRQVYSFPPMVQPMYHPQACGISQPTKYCQHSTPSQNHQTTASAPETVMPYQQPSELMQPTTLSSHPQPSVVNSKMPGQSTPRLPSVVSQPQMMPRIYEKPGLVGIPGESADSAVNTDRVPGPILATTPRIVHEDDNGVPRISFRYSRDRVKTEYTIRCDVGSVDTKQLSQNFMAANCVYPRARCSEYLYKGNRFAYESDCNSVAWALASLNPSLREKRGLIQRAVDSWRNSNKDSRLRSRRVRKADRINSRKT